MATEACVFPGEVAFAPMGSREGSLVPFVVLEVQPTPNPNAVKLLLDGQVAAEPVSLRSCEDAGGTDLARRLMAVKGVSAVLLLRDFVTINKSPKARWADITRRIKRVLAETDESPGS